MISNISKKIIKAIISILAILMVTVILFTNTSLAASNSPHVVTQLSYPSIFDILSNQVDGDEVFIRHEDLLSIPSLFCSAKGTALPGYAGTVVRTTVNGVEKSTDVTDQGVKTGFLTEADKNSATVFLKNAQWTTDTTNPYSETTSKTYGRFHLVDTKIATPAEAWVLAEMDKNDPAVNSIVFETTDREYTGEVNDNNKTVTANGDELWSVAWDSSSLEPTEYVTLENGKYYYVDVDSYAPYTYVQHAWWKVKTVGTANKSGVKDTDLGYEAEAFEEYIKRISPTGDSWQYNSDNTIVVDYENYISEDGSQKQIGYDSDDAEVRFNSETNKYIVGPFTLDYLRAGTIQGDRDKVSFAGISETILTGLDAEDNQINLELGTDYKFVFSHNHEDYIPLISNNGQQVPLDTEADYPYPYDGEEFYLEISYLDDLVKLESLSFDFQYMNAGASFEYLEGTYLIITWSPWYNSRLASSGATGVTPATATTRINNKLKLAMNISSRQYPSDNGTSTKEVVVPQTIIDTSSNHFNQDSYNTQGNITCIPDEDKIQISAKITKPKDTSTTKQHIKIEKKYSSSPKSVEVYVDGNKIESKVDAEGNVTATYNRDYNSPIVKNNIEIKYSYTYKTTWDGKPQGSEQTGNWSIKKEYRYENDIVEKIQFIDTDCTYVEKDGDTIYLRKLGVITHLGVELNTIAKLKTGKIENGKIEWSYSDGVNPGLQESIGDTTTLKFVRPNKKEFIVTVTVYSDYYQDVPTQQLSFKVMLEPMYLMKEKDKTKPGSKKLEFTNFSNSLTEREVYIYNAYLNIDSKLDEGDNNYDGYNYIITEGDDSDLDNGKIIYRATPDNVGYAKEKRVGMLSWLGIGEIKKETTGEMPNEGVLTQSLNYEYYDGCGEEVTVVVEGTIYNTLVWKERLQNEINDFIDEIKEKGYVGSHEKEIIEDYLHQIEMYGFVDNNNNNVYKDLERELKRLKQGFPVNSGSEQGGSEQGGSEQGGSQQGGSQQGGSQQGGSEQGGSQQGGSQQGGSQQGGSQQGGSQQGGSGQGGSGQGGSQQGAHSGGINSGLQSSGARYYKYYLKYTNQSEHIAQHQINGKDSVKKNIDAQNGAGTPEEEIVNIEIILDIDLRTSMAGMVWIDEDEQKDASSGTLGIYDGQDKPAPENSVEVIIYKVKYEVSTGKEVDRDYAIFWDENGDEQDFSSYRMYIDSDGKYEIPSIQVPAEEGLDGSQYVMSYDVEFIYDGQTYEATEYLVPEGKDDKDTVDEKLEAFKKEASETAGGDKDYTEYAKSSYIVENADERYDFDKKFAEIFGDKPITDDGKTEGKATGAKLNYESEVVGTEGAQKTKSNLVTHDANNFVYSQYQFAARTSEAGLLLPYERKYHVTEKYYDNYTFQSEDYKPIDEYFHQINLGLLERYHSDIGVKKDLYTANVVVNGNSNVTKYNSLMPLTEEALNLQIKPEYRQHTYKIDLYNSDYMYRSGAYNSITDELTKTIVKAIKDGTELRLFVTYKLEFINESVHTDVSINEFVDYYDKSFTRIDQDVKAEIEDQTAADGEPSRIEKTIAYAPYYRKLKTVGVPTAYNYNKAEDLNESVDESGNVINTVVNSGGELILDKSSNGFATGSVTFKDEGDAGNYKQSSSASLRGNDNNNPNEDLTLEPGEVLEVFVTYEVDRTGYEQARQEDVAKDETRKNNLLGEKNNIVEVSNYSTFYTEEACRRHSTTRYDAKHISGRVDQDSAPDNIDITKVNNSSDTKMLEDDTEFAPCVTVEVREAEPRTLDGVVWEDSRTDHNVGDGIYQDTEQGIKGIDVTMVEKIRVTTEDLEKIKAYAQQTNPSAFNDLKDLDFLSHEFEYIWKSDAFDGFKNEITSGDNGKYEFKNFVSGTYVVRFEYGNEVNETDLKYNGQDYKNTSYQTEKVNPVRNDDNKEIPIDTSDIIHLSGKSTLNNEWHDLSSNDNAKALENDRVSDARDYEPQRLRTIAYSRTITNENAEVLASAIEHTKDVTSEEAIKHVSDEYKDILKKNQQEFVDNTRMVANTAKLFIDIEKQDTIAYKRVRTEDGDEIIKVTEAKDDPNEKHEYYVKNIDFGLVERPETRLNIRKEISAIQLLKNDGKELLLGVKFDENGNLIKDSAQGNESVRLEKISEINKESLGDGQGFKYIAMETKMLNGLQVKLTYRIEVINNSELDYTTATLARSKKISDLYTVIDRFENTDQEKLYSEEGLQGTVPFNSGKAIIYGRYLGTYYYTNKYIDNAGQINTLYGAKDVNGTEYDKYEQEVVVKTTIDQLVDYIDNDLSVSIKDINYENAAWVGSSDADREHKLSEIAYEKAEDGTYNKDIKLLQDDKQRAYVAKNNSDVTKNNIYMSTNDIMVSEPMKITYNVAEVKDDKQPVMEVNADGLLIPKVGTREYNAYTTKESIDANIADNSNGVLTTELVPEEYKKTHADAISTGEIEITTAAQASEEAINNMNYDNLVEIAMYSNSVGRRDMQAIPGNANMIAKDNRAFLAGYIKAYNADTKTYEFKTQTVTYTKDGQSITVNTERDAYAARDTVTFSEPTGLSLERQKANKTIRVLLASLIIAAIAVVAAIVVTAVRKNKYDDTDILKTKN